jgi:peptidoglycan hydrolase-like protein with peptidoglycan-binding domain
MKTKAITFAKGYMHKHLGHIVTFMSSAFLVLALALGFTQFASAQTMITATAGPGSTGANVTSIQTYLASNPSFYPQGLVTGYYGALTQAAVQRFQAFYGIVSSGSPSTTGYGRVGPLTLAKMNALISGGTGGTTIGDISAPYISGITIAGSSNSATISWNTNELATGRVYYSTAPITFNEGNENSVGFSVTSGQSASFDTTTRMVHGATITGLSSNTTYYYLIVVTDPSGNVSISTPGATFRTGL